jgi:hypothetical protein
MRRTNGTFSPRERKAALWALLMAGLIVAMGMMIQQWSPASVGSRGSEAYMTVSVPGVLDAQPIN